MPTPFFSGNWGSNHKVGRDQQSGKRLPYIVYFGGFDPAPATCYKCPFCALVCLGAD